VALVGDYNEAVLAHQAIPKALQLAAKARGCEIEGNWIHTSSIANPSEQLREFDGIWCVPASPYANTAGALEAIRYAREQNRPFLGTCGGFQHAILEYGRNVCGVEKAEHAENNPGAGVPLISLLACPLIEESEDLDLVQGTRIHAAYHCDRITEGYHCRYGLNPRYQSDLFRDGLLASAHDRSGQVRAAELDGHRFFLATLFQPERRALRGEVPPVVAAFVEAMACPR
jgi:CTP synthase (UTP-ammonia lyase)